MLRGQAPRSGSMVTFRKPARSPRETRPAASSRVVAHAGQVQIDTVGQMIVVVAEQLHGVERDEAWRQIITTAPRYAKDAKKTDRQLPIILLVAAGGPAGSARICGIVISDLSGRTAPAGGHPGWRWGLSGPGPAAMHELHTHGAGSLLGPGSRLTEGLIFWPVHRGVHREDLAGACQASGRSYGRI
jgi:hypothetical protein